MMNRWIYIKHPAAAVMVTKGPAAGTATLDGKAWVKVRARKKHRCAACECPILAGEPVWRPLGNGRSTSFALQRNIRICVVCLQ